MAMAAVAFVIAALIASRKAETLPCFSDQQVRSVLIDAHFFVTEQMAGICARRFPDMKEQIQDLMQKLETTYSAELSNIDRLSVEAFEQNHPGYGREMRDKSKNVVLERARREGEGYTRGTCNNIMSQIEALANAGWSSAADFPLSFFDEERAQVPRC
jgi:hypothetical protein